MQSQEPEPFTTRMRRATRSVHSISDALVNTKFALSLSDEKVWAGGLLVFYHVFAYLEDAKERLKSADMDSLFVHKIVYRKQALEADLTHYLGEGWRSLPRPEPVLAYLRHLEQLERSRPLLLTAYVYHLYLGLLSGGQILARKRRLTGDRSQYKDQVTDLTGADIPQLKRDFKAAMNEIASRMSREEQDQLIEESNRVFHLNNSIVRTVGGQGQVLGRILMKLTFVGVLVTAVVMAYRMYK